jgi:thiol-disulfide isomerase/thioredoxin
VEKCRRAFVFKRESAVDKAAKIEYGKTCKAVRAGKIRSFPTRIRDFNMNKILKVNLFAALILAACISTPKSYIIEGVVPDDSYNNQMVYMLDYETDLFVDSILVVDGKFTFTGSVNIAVPRGIKLNRLFVIFILENGKISVDMADRISAKGTPLNNELSKYLSEMEVYRAPFLKKRDEIRKMQDIDDITYKKLYDENFKNFGENIYLMSTKFFNANKNNALGTFALLNLLNFLEPNKFDSLYIQAGDIVRNFKPLKNKSEINARQRETAEGKHFTDFKIENGNIDGSSASLSDYVGKGKYVLVDFWASWCGPCIAEIPVLVEVYNKYKGDKFEILGVAINDKREDTMKAIEKHSIPWTHIINTGNIPTTLYGIDLIPHIILFAPDGTIVARDLRGNSLKAKVEEVMLDCI